MRLRKLILVLFYITFQNLSSQINVDEYYQFLEKHIKERKYFEVIKKAKQIQGYIPEEIISHSLGRVYYRMALYDSAIIYYTKLCHVHSGNEHFKHYRGEGFWMLGRIYSELGNAREAIKELTKAAIYLPHETELWSTIGYEQILDSQFVEAEMSLKKSIELDSNYSFAYSNYGYLLIQLDRLDEAESYLNKSMKLFQENSYLLKYFAYLYIKRKDYAKSCEYIQLAMEMENFKNNKNKIAYGNLSNMNELDNMQKKYCIE